MPWLKIEADHSTLYFDVRSFQKILTSMEIVDERFVILTVSSHPTKHEFCLVYTRHLTTVNFSNIVRNLALRNREPSFLYMKVGLVKQNCRKNK